jgi:outer membrane immunogenic protein
MNRIGFATIALTSVVGSYAIAADLPQAYQPAPVVAALPQSWTGFYIGANVGGAWQDVSATPVSVVNGVFINPATINFSGGGVLAGGQAGFNYQMSNFLVGLEGDFSWTDAKATITTLGTGVSTGAVSTGTAQTGWYATLGPRLGFVLYDLLFYGKGGAAWTSATYSGSTTLVTTTTVAPTQFTALGWMVGGGIEWSFAHNWSVKAEYDYLNFGTKNFTTVGTTPGFLPVIGTDSVKDTANIGKLGVNYRFF